MQSVNRRGRLAVLRSRMRTEFGPTLNGAGGLPTDEETSECTSLASWGRNLLMEQNGDLSVIAVRPADTMSTKAQGRLSPLGHHNGFGQSLSLSPEQLPTTGTLTMSPKRVVPSEGTHFYSRRHVNPLNCSRCNRPMCLTKIAFGRAIVPAAGWPTTSSSMLDDFGRNYCIPNYGN